MSSIVVEEKHVLEYIKDSIYEMRQKLEIVEHARYHHNTSYEQAVSICKYGILSMEEQNKLGIRNDSKDILKIMGDTTSHVNGSDAISLSVVGLEDLYPDEEEYNPYSMTQVDFLISSDIRSSRTTHHYGNEFLSYSNIGVENLKSVDIRLLNFIDFLNKRNKDSISIDKIIDKYNSLRDIALSIKQNNLYIPIREMSSLDGFSIDMDALSEMSKIIIK